MSLHFKFHFEKSRKNELYYTFIVEFKGIFYGWKKSRSSKVIYTNTNVLFLLMNKSTVAYIFCTITYTHVRSILKLYMTDLKSCSHINKASWKKPQMGEGEASSGVFNKFLYLTLIKKICIRSPCRTCKEVALSCETCFLLSYRLAERKEDRAVFVFLLAGWMFWSVGMRRKVAVVIEEEEEN